MNERLISYLIRTYKAQTWTPGGALVRDEPQKDERNAQVVADNAEDEDGEPESIAGEVAVPAGELCEDLVLVFCPAESGSARWGNGSARLAFEAKEVPCRATMFQYSGFCGRSSSAWASSHFGVMERPR